MCLRARGRPPPIFESWNAVWTRRAASATSDSLTTNEMLRSDEPCAMATTLILAVARAVKTRAAMPGVPTMPSPTTAITDIPLRVYLLATASAIEAGNLFAGLGKTPFLALAIGLIACGQGLAAQGGAAAVGARTTGAVVLAILGVIVTNAVFTLFFTLMGI